jgi:hypothetical protein
MSDILEEGKKIVMERDNWKQELILTQQRLMEMEGWTPECSHGDLEDNVRDLERQLCARAPEQADLAEDMEDAQAQLEIMTQSANEHWEQVSQILSLSEGRTVGEGHQEEREEKGNEIACFLGEDRKELRG